MLPNSHLSLVATHILIASVLFATINDYNGIVHLQAFILFDLPHLFFQSGDGLLSGQAWGCDLSYDYVKINAEYTTQKNSCCAVSYFSHQSLQGIFIQLNPLISFCFLVLTFYHYCILPMTKVSMHNVDLLVQSILYFAINTSLSFTLY